METRTPSHAWSLVRVDRNFTSDSTGEVHKTYASVFQRQRKDSVNGSSDDTLVRVSSPSRKLLGPGNALAATRQGDFPTAMCDAKQTNRFVSILRLRPGSVAVETVNTLARFLQRNGPVCRFASFLKRLHIPSQPRLVGKEQCQGRRASSDNHLLYILLCL